MKKLFIWLILFLLTSCNKSINNSQNIINLSSISLSSTYLTIYEGEEEQLTINFYPENASNKNATFTSSNIDVASVTNTGLVKAINEGQAMITATSLDGSYVASCQIEVKKVSSNNFGFAYYDNYYGELSWENGEDLKNKLHNIIAKDKNDINYDNPNWESTQNSSTSLSNNYNVDVLYSDCDFLKTETNTSWQREHAYCASLMTGFSTSEAVTADKGRAVDLHNLFASYSAGNASRGNKNYGLADINSTYYRASGSDNKGLGDYSSDELNFEPSDIDKGKVARAIFYMGVMYNQEEIEEIKIKKGTATIRANVKYKPLQIVDEYVSYSKISYDNWLKNESQDVKALTAVYGTDIDGYINYSYENCSFKIGNLSTLLNWNNYNVDYLEYQHNESVYSSIYTGSGYSQNNRNPFIDYPALVDYVYGDKQNESGSLDLLEPTYLALNFDKNQHHHYFLKNAKTTYQVGETFSLDDVTVVDVINYYNHSQEVSDFTCSLLNHTFNEEDGKIMSVNLSINGENISYDINISNTNSISYSQEMKKSSIDNNKINVNQEITYGPTSWIFNILGTSGYTIQNVSTGGFKMGSNTKAIKYVSITSKDEINVDYVSISAKTCNKDSCFKLTIKVGDNIILDEQSVTNTDTLKIYEKRLTTPIKGYISFVFEGANALNLGTIGYNEIV